MHIAIIGNGITGITAARTIRKKSDCEITVISSESKHFFSRTALMYIYMGHMKYEHTKPYEDFFWEKNRINLKEVCVQSVDFENNILSFDSGENLKYDKLLIASGSKSNMFGWPGQDLKGVQGLYSLQDLELLEKNTHPAHTPASKMKVKNAVIVGGGLIGVELAEMLHTRNIHVTFLIREKRFWGNVLPKEEGELIMDHLRKQGVQLMLSTELKEIFGDENGRVKSIITSSGEEINCELVGLTAGVSPNVDFLSNSNLKINRGIVVDGSMKTNIENVYAAGDCAEIENPTSGRKSIEQVWYTGRMMGEVAGKNMIGDSAKYEPGPWFNSAKFFDIEYQTYGKVSSELENGTQSFYWENESKDKCLKMIYDESDKRLLGVNVFGIRLRHEKFDAWLRSAKTIDFVMKHFRDALFDPEFSKDETVEIIRAYNQEFGVNIEPLKKNWKRIFA